MAKRPSRQAGFTLVEVLAALLIFSLSIISLTHAGTESVKTAFALEQKILAGIVADNQLVLARAETLNRSERRGRDEMRGQAFDWEVETHNTDLDGFFRLSVKVRAASQNVSRSRRNSGGRSADHVLIERTAFVAGRLDGQ